MPEITEQADLGGIIDIEPPLLPIEISSEFTVLVVSVLLLLALTIYFIQRKRSLRIRARKQLSHLQKAYANHSIDTRTTAYRLATAVRIGLRLEQLSAQTGIPSRLQHHKQRWGVFIERLYSLRYEPYEQTEENINALFNEADFWLRRWR